MPMGTDIRDSAALWKMACPLLCCPAEPCGPGARAEPGRRASADEDQGKSCEGGALAGLEEEQAEEITHGSEWASGDSAGPGAVGEKAAGSDKAQGTEPGTAAIPGRGTALPRPALASPDAQAPGDSGSCKQVPRAPPADRRPDHEC